MFHKIQTTNPTCSCHKRMKQHKHPHTQAEKGMLQIGSMIWRIGQITPEQDVMVTLVRRDQYMRTQILMMMRCMSRQPSPASTTKRAGTSRDVETIPAKQHSTRPEAEKRTLEEHEHIPRVTNKCYNFRQTPAKRALLDYEYETQAKRCDCRTPALKRDLPEDTDRPSKKSAPSNQANEVSATSNQRGKRRYTGEQWEFTAAFLSR